MTIRDLKTGDLFKFSFAPNDLFMLILQTKTRSWWMSLSYRSKIYTAVKECRVSKVLNKG